MNAGEWIADFLINKGATDVFGMPGVVVMDFLYAIEKRKPEITPHLCYHEQGGAFAACGYAQATGKLGVAYSTRGPGLTNMITAIADAYYDSIPCMFFTAHSCLNMVPGMRVMNNQEIDTVSLVSNITTYAVRIDSIENLQKEVVTAYYKAATGRKGPVVLDIYSALFSQMIDEGFDEYQIKKSAERDSSSEEIAQDAVADIENRIKASRRPVILIGNGMRYADTLLLNNIAKKHQIPIVSSRSAQDLLSFSDMYFGFVGSRATRYSNFILSKTDLIISIGNRLSFPVNSKSFKPIVEGATTIRIDCDKNEFLRPVPNSVEYCIDANKLLPYLEKADLFYTGSEQWVNVCRVLMEKLDEWDKIPVIEAIMNIITSVGNENTIACDVGNHSFWVTSALAYLKQQNRILYSASFGTLGSALPKSIGAYYSTGKPVICFAGDQGIQMNIQEMQYISEFQIPIVMVVLNNQSSGMILEREIAKYGDFLVHTTEDSGYSYPSFEKIAALYGFEYLRIETEHAQKPNDFVFHKQPILVEIMVDKDTKLAPSLPQGSECQDLAPLIPRDLYRELNNL